jgi:hypothetical protein
VLSLVVRELGNQEFTGLWRLGLWWRLMEVDVGWQDSWLATRCIDQCAGTGFASGCQPLMLPGKAVGRRRCYPGRPTVMARSVNASTQRLAVSGNMKISLDVQKVHQTERL